MRKLVAGGLCIGLLWAAPAFADQAYTGTIVPAWSDPALTGYTTDVNGQFVFRDTTNTAVWSINNGYDTTGNVWVAQLVSGDDFNRNGSPSTVNFFGSTSFTAVPNTEFQVGTLTYHNGTSNTGTNIFGAILTLSVLNQPSITPYVTHMDMVNTSNIIGDPFASADILSFPDFDLSLHVFEGAAVTANVFGGIFGDPELRITRLELVGRDPQGFLGPAIVLPVPEPDSLALLGIAIALVPLMGRKHPRARAFGSLEA